MQTGRDNCIRIGLFLDKNPVLVSPAYTTFEVSSPRLLPEYLFMYFNSKEKDRYGAFLSDSSVRSNLDWDRFCDIVLEIPSIEIQRKYVAIYEGFLANLHSYEKGLDDLKLVCDGYIEDLRKRIKPSEIGNYINEQSDKNKDGQIELVLGVDSSGSFVPTKANMDGINLTNYKIVHEGDFAYNPSRINLGSISLREGEPCIVSPMYQIFRVDGDDLLSEYLFMWLRRTEFLRSTLFYAVGSVRDTFDLKLMKEIKIPIPDIEIQRSIVEVFITIDERTKILSRLKEEIASICPVLIRGSIEESKRGSL
jgi:type I restriction enzyme S subunit